MTEAIASWCSAWRPSDKGARAEWAEEHVRPPGSARGTSISMEATPWLREPIDFSSDNRVREQVCLMPTGAGKTSIFDCVIPHAIAEDPGGILLVLQTDPDAREYFEERLLPELRGAEPVADIMAAMDRHAIRKEAVMFPHMPLYMGGANRTNLQRKSVRYVLGDEVWTWKHGLVAEARARTHDRWNSRIILVSQGGMAQMLRDSGPVDTELESAWQRTDRREWCFQCPRCGEVQKFSLKCLRYDKPDGEINENAISSSARYVCVGSTREEPTCAAFFEDKINVRRALANSGRYVVTNPSHLARHHGWHCNALTLYYVSWGTIAVEHAKAMRSLKEGDDTAIRTFRQKRMGENYREDAQIIQTGLNLGDYSLADYMAGEMWDGEAFRFMTVDVQRDHFWAVIRAWKVGGASRRVWVGKVATKQGLRDLQQTMKVQEKWVFVDSGHDADFVYNLCAEFGWWAIKGDGVEKPYSVKQRLGPPVFKWFSEFRYVQGSAGLRCRFMLWAVNPIKRTLEKMRGGYKEAWEVERDITPSNERQLFSEIEKDVRNKQTGQITRRFVKIHADNHHWDCEGMQLVPAQMAGVLLIPVAAETPKEKPSPEELSEG